MQLISEEYKVLNRKLHKSRPDYGARGNRFAEVVLSMGKVYDTRDVLDYGCGKGQLRRALAMMDVKEYDPGIIGKEVLPEPADIVACFDVLEHIEPECLDSVLSHIFTLSKRTAIINVATRPAAKFLEDGRNSHLTIQPYLWWLNKLDEYDWELVQFNRSGMGEFLSIYAKNELELPDEAD